MTREDINRINSQYLNDCENTGEMEEIFDLANKALEQEPCDDCVSRKEVEKLIYRFLTKATDENIAFYEHFLDLPSVTPQEPKTGHCKDCNWWKDSDGEYRRGCGAESQCPINTHAVYSGEGYCYKFSPKADMREVE